MPLPYRVAAERTPPPAKPPSDVFVLRKYGPIWVVGATLSAVACAAFGAWLYSRTTLECDRAAPAAKAECRLVTYGLFGAQTADLRPSSSSVHVQDAMLSDDDTRPTLGIHPDGKSVQWFQLGARNADVEATFGDFVRSDAPGHLTLPIDRRLGMPALLPLMGIAMLALVLLLESKQRVLVWADTGRVQVERRGLLRQRFEAVYELDEMAEVETRQEGEDSNFYWVVLVGSGGRHDLCVGSSSVVSPIQACLARVIEARHRALEPERRGRRTGEGR